MNTRNPPSEIPVNVRRMHVFLLLHATLGRGMEHRERYTTSQGWCQPYHVPFKIWPLASEPSNVILTASISQAGGACFIYITYLFTDSSGELQTFLDSLLCIHSNTNTNNLTSLWWEEFTCLQGISGIKRRYRYSATCLIFYATGPISYLGINDHHAKTLALASFLFLTVFSLH